MNQPNSGHLEDPSSRNHVDAGLRGSPNLCFGNLQVLTKENPNSWIKPLGLLMFLLPIQLIYWTKQNNPKQSIYIILYNNVCPGLWTPGTSSFPRTQHPVRFTTWAECRLQVNQRIQQPKNAGQCHASAMPVPVPCHFLFEVRGQKITQRPAYSSYDVRVLEHLRVWITAKSCLIMSVFFSQVPPGMDTKQKHKWNIQKCQIRNSGGKNSHHKNHQVLITNGQPLSSAAFLVVGAAPCLGANAAVPRTGKSTKHRMTKWGWVKTLSPWWTSK